MLGLRLKWLGCACFEFDFDGMHVVTDPWITQNEKTPLTWEAVEKCDYITLTHAHHDHIMDIPALMQKFPACLMCGEGTAMPLMQWADVSPMRMYPMNAGLELDFEKVKIQALFGRHTPLAESASERAAFWKGHRIHGQSAVLYQLSEQGDLEYRNFLYTLPNGVKVLHWGNTVRRPEEKTALRRLAPDVAIMQVTGSAGAEEMAQMCKHMGCKVVIAHHIDFPGDYMHHANALGAALAETAPEIQYIIPQYGKWLEL